MHRLTCTGIVAVQGHILNSPNWLSHMKNNSIIHIILAVAIAVLYVLHFTGKKGGMEISPAESGGLYYINIDTLNAGLDFLKVKQAELEQKEMEFEEQFRKKASALEKEIAIYQKQAQGGLLTPKQMQAREQQLGQRQQVLMVERDSTAQALLLESQEINTQLMEKLKQFITEFNQTNNAQMIFAYSETGNILHANKGMDITKEVLKKMNAGK